jgi:hypothetical protein
MHGERVGLSVMGMRETMLEMEGSREFTSGHGSVRDAKPRVLTGQEETSGNAMLDGPEVRHQRDLVPPL